MSTSSASRSGRRARPDHDPTDAASARRIALALRGAEPVDTDDHDLSGPWSEQLARVSRAVPNRRGEALGTWCDAHRDPTCDGESMGRAIDQAMAEPPLLSVLSVPGVEDSAESSESRLTWSGRPRPIRDDLHPVPALRPEMIPSPLRAWLLDIADRISCPLEFPVVAALVALAIVLGRRVAIRPKRHDDWTVVANLWGALVGRPGIMKTPALSEACRPLRRLEADARRDHDEAMTAHKAKTLVRDVQTDTAKTELKNAAKVKKSEAELADLARAIVRGEATPEPTARRYTTSEPTVESLGVLQAESHNGSIGLLRDELTGWFRSLEKSDRQCDRAFYLEGWNGNGLPFNYDRIGRGNILIPSPCVSILGGIQPGPLRKIVRGVARGEDADDGLISRFQLLVWPDTAAEWRNVDRWPDTAAKNRAHSVYQALDVLNVADVGATPDEDDGPPYLHFAHDAQELFDEWRAGLEAKIRTPDESPLIESHLAKYRSLMPSLALHHHLVDVVDGGTPGPVTLQAAQLAVEWCEILEAHARRVYACAAEPDLVSARALSEKITSGVLPSPFGHRDVYRKCWSRLDTPDDVRRAVAILEEYGWVQPVAVPHTGGAPREDVYIHPDLPRRPLEKI